MEKTIRQCEVAKWLGISASFISRVKKGEKGFSPATAQRLAYKTGLSLDLLFSEDGGVKYDKLLNAYKEATCSGTGKPDNTQAGI